MENLVKWYKAYVDLVGHPKRYILEAELDTIHGLHYIHCWFAYIAKYSKDGDVTEFKPKEIARACEWSGDADRFFGALSLAGFIDKVKGGDGGFRLIAHDWLEENKRFIEENRKTKPLGKPRETQGLPVLEEKRREEIRIEKQDQEPPSALENGWNPITDLMDCFKKNDVIITTRDPRQLAVLTAKAKAIADKWKFLAICKAYCTDQFCRKGGLSINGLINNFDRIANQLESNSHKEPKKLLRFGQ